MKIGIRLLFLSFVISFLGTYRVIGGNPERVGQAGATQLLINPFARSSGVFGINVANSFGIESIINNPAGLSHTRRTEVVFAHTRWLADIGINTLAVGQSLGKSGGVLGLYVSAYSFGDIPITTIDNPDGGIGTYSPTFMNLGVTYAKSMVQDRIYVGATIKLISESLPNVSATGIAFDAGAQYKDKKDRVQLGVALRNVGPEMEYAGDGLSTRAALGGVGAPFDNQVRIPSAAFQIPSQLLIGISYTGTIGKNDTSYSYHKLIPMITFVSNSFSSDQLGVGIEYRFNMKNADLFSVRAAYLYEADITSKEESRNAFMGLALGASFELPLSKFDPDRKSRTTFGLDYSLRPTYFFGIVHTLGIRFNL
ncbi:MAG: PorV/PorQ family protein [Bacteroidia bacterium]|nr:PorV/PorQ family protein [Bacteroidia bacterium]MDW8157572.1 PorV/PorQ family protein [Bacteroidia bacterium]